jgi:hypothetical protein
MQGDNTFMAFEQAPVSAVPTFYNPGCIFAVRTFDLTQKIAKSIVAQRFI